MTIHVLELPMIDFRKKLFNFQLHIFQLRKTEMMSLTKQEMKVKPCYTLSCLESILKIIPLHDCKFKCYKSKQLSVSLLPCSPPWKQPVLVSCVKFI